MADKDEGIRRKAAYALGRIAADPQETLAVLLAAFKDDNEDVRQAASDALAKFGAEAVPGIMKALKDSDVKVRLQAAHAVTEMGTEAKDTAPVLRELLLGKEVEQCSCALSTPQAALAKLGKTGVPALIDGFKDDRPNVSQACVQSLSGVGADAVPALQWMPWAKRKSTVRRPGRPGADAHARLRQDGRHRPGLCRQERRGRPGALILCPKTFSTSALEQAGRARRLKHA